jgi:C1A family cysteine protease
MTRKIQRYGWQPDLPDQRDFTYKTIKPTTLTLPTSIDVRNASNIPVDQGDLGSCTGNSIASCDYFVQIKNKHPYPAYPSRLAIYYGERLIEGTVSEDSGAMIRDGFKVLANIGAASEKTWPYIISKFARKPTKAYFTAAAKRTAIAYYRIDNTNLSALKTCLAEGYPFVFGFTVYESFESDQVTQTGAVPMPSVHEAMLGGHATLAVGYNDLTQRFLVQNSWGTEWGDKGFFTIPYAYLTNTNLADDFWTLRSIK